MKRTFKLAKALKPSNIYEWLIKKGYFPEPYVLPPCFKVTRYPSYGKKYFSHSRRSFHPKLTECLQVSFPKTNLTDRTFGIMDPEIHSDIALTIAKHWRSLIKCFFNNSNKVCSYSFPIPLDCRRLGSIGSLRGGRLIYEFIEMAENDLAAIAYRYKYLIKTDIKNFYPSIYTHSIAWAVHGKKKIRKNQNRFDYTFFGNRLDKLFQSASDGCTNGISVGPVVSDFISEIILAAVDKILSPQITENTVVVRFKDDYRILSKTKEEGNRIIKELQSALREYKLELNDTKTEIFELPNGIFRNWVSQYHVVNPKPKAFYTFVRFKEVFLSVIKIDRENPGCGVIDRFLADITTKKYKLKIQLDTRSLPKIISLLLMLGELRIKAFPKVLAIIEAVLRTPFGKQHVGEIVEHLEKFLDNLRRHETHNKYLIIWIGYFIRANNLENRLRNESHHFKDPIARSVYTSRFSHFKTCRDFLIFVGIKTIAKETNMLKHLDIFKPQ